MMLNSIKEKSKGVITYVIVGLISLTFIITALYGVDFNGSGETVATINSEEISKEEFLSEFNPKKRQLQQELA
ncbi:MAG: peptidylprolyl isomerase, partial [Candidatus Ruthia sp.]|nr:peptidylprolyl isomerase [Candidatus Ruthturnera sp.]